MGSAAQLIESGLWAGAYPLIGAIMVLHMGPSPPCCHRGQSTLYCCPHVPDSLTLALASTHSFLAGLLQYSCSHPGAAWLPLPPAAPSPRPALSVLLLAAGNAGKSWGRMPSSRCQAKCGASGSKAAPDPGCRAPAPSSFYPLCLPGLSS